MPAPLACGLHRPEDRPPNGMTGLCRLKLERRVGGKRLAKFVAALALALRRAVDEREVLVRVRAIAVVQAELERGLQAAGGFRILATVVLAQSQPKRAATVAELENFAQLIAQIAHGLR